MCGRYYLETKLPPEEETPEMIAAFRTAASGRDGARDIAPGDDAPVLTRRGEGLCAQVMRWGFASKGGLVINARLESLYERPMFRPLAQRQRCAMPAAGYYEWRDADGQKYRVGFENGAWFFLAGLYRFGMNGPEFVVVTQPPAPAVATIHDRMPLMLDRGGGLERWMGGAEAMPEMNYRLRVAPVGPEQLQMTF